MALIDLDPSDNKTSETNHNDTTARSESSDSDSKSVRIVCISDTHSMHQDLTDELIKLYQSANDILIHSGDLSNRGRLQKLQDVDEWFGKLPYKHIIVISGNMDGLTLEGKLDGRQVFQNAIYLEHSLHELSLQFIDKSVCALSIFGSPWTPKFCGGFQIRSNKQAHQLWDSVPSVDILVTHGPPKGVMDTTSQGMTVGDKVLREAVLNTIKPRLMVFGHIHASHGRYEMDYGEDADNVSSTVFVNAAQHDMLAAYGKAKDGIIVETLAVQTQIASE